MSKKLNLQRTDPVSRFYDIGSNMSDTVDFDITIRGVHVNGAGNIRGLLADDISETPMGITVLAGMYYPYCFKRIFTTGTTATGLIGLI